ncbi:MAG: aromatic ring-hydroxylating dioxygenase subunit alpha [bacterium]|nr:aromatic ring-hydroxylating dioxygenase subunit alpha [bacterium]
MVDIEKLVSPDGSLVSRRLWFDEEVYRLEQERVFGRCWLFLGHESQIRDPGEYFTTTIGEAPVIIVRGKDGKIHGHLNSCTHRGLRVCRSDSGKAANFVCPYHGWIFANDGRLVGMPEQREAYSDLDMSKWGLIPVARVESYKGLIFGNLDANAISLRDYLGDLAFYLDAQVDRREGGTELVGGVHRWRVKANWKMPAENMVGDVYHAAWSHQSIVRLQSMSPLNSDPDGVISGYGDIQQHGVNFACANGHGGTTRFYPVDAHPEQRMPGEAPEIRPPEVNEYFRRVQPEADERLGPVKSRIKGATLTVFPTLSILGSVFTIRVAHPRGPQESEIWSWVLVDRDAPQEVKDYIRGYYTFTFGPGGTFESDDGENWEQVTEGARIAAAADHPFHFGMSQGKEYAHAELPGQCGPILSEHTQRAMYRQWHDLMVKP